MNAVTMIIWIVALVGFLRAKRLMDDPHAWNAMGAMDVMARMCVTMLMLVVAWCLLRFPGLLISIIRKLVVG